jgi:ElaB/YqjD/DUF883 family membrane-anchored ribosome-binding protein
MDQKANRSGLDRESTQSAVTEQLGMIEGRVHETMDETKSTIDTVMDSIQQVQTTIEGAKSAVDNVLETAKFAMDETIERVKYTTDLIEQVNQNPWIMFGGAVLMGYVLGTVGSEGFFDKRHASGHGGETALPGGRPPAS